MNLFAVVTSNGLNLMGLFRNSMDAVAFAMESNQGIPLEVKEISLLEAIGILIAQFR